MSRDQYKKSVPLYRLRDALTSYMEQHPESRTKPVYFDQLHIVGVIETLGEDALELI